MRLSRNSCFEEAWAALLMIAGPSKTSDCLSNTICNVVFQAETAQHEVQEGVVDLKDIENTYKSSIRSFAQGCELQEDTQTLQEQKTSCQVFAH